MLSVLVTGHDLYLGIHDTERDELSQYCTFDDIREMYPSKNRIMERIQGMEKGDIKPHPDHLAKLWGRQIVKICMEDPRKRLSVDERIRLAKIQENIKKIEGAYHTYNPVQHRSER